MSDPPLSRDVRHAFELLRSDLGRTWRMAELARLCGVPRRSLDKHFRSFLGCGPAAFLQRERLEEVRRRLLRATPRATVTEVAIACGFTHFGRFALAYRARFGHSPSEALRWARSARMACAVPRVLALPASRPSIEVLPFALAEGVPAGLGELGQEVAAQLRRSGWARQVPSPGGRYRLEGRVSPGATGGLRIRMTLIDRAQGHYVWADVFDAAVCSMLEDWVAGTAARMLATVLRDAELARASRPTARDPLAWALSMRALPMVVAADPSAHGTAMALLQRAVEADPADPLPRALTAWLHGLRAGHQFTPDAARERQAARDAAATAGLMPPAGALPDVMLSAAHALVHDLAASEHHARRALELDGGSSWAWGRLAFVHNYRGEAEASLECCRIAHALAPQDPLQYLWSLGIASASFELGRFGEAAAWYRRTLAEQPKAIWVNRFLAAALVFAGEPEAARHSLATLRAAFPALTIAQVADALPHTRLHRERLAEGLDAAGLPRA